MSEPVGQTEIVLTGTGVPHPRPDRAGAGALVRHGDTLLQFDAGRSTVMRLMQAEVSPHELTAVFLTHVHSDHVIGLPDLAMTRWVLKQLHAVDPLTVVAPEGPTTRFVTHMLDPFAEDIAIRQRHVGSGPVEVDLRSFDVPSTPEVVWTSEDEAVKVSAVMVHHEPVPDAVAFRVDTPSGAVVISGDTRVCDEVEALASGADVLVHEACRQRSMARLVAGTPFENVFDYHADTVGLGAMAERSGVPHLVLTHLVPVTDNPADLSAFAAEVREGGYTGELTIGEDLMRFSIGTSPEA